LQEVLVLVYTVALSIEASLLLEDFAEVWCAFRLQKLVVVVFLLPLRLLALSMLQEELHVVIADGAGSRAQEVAFVTRQLRCALSTVSLFFNLADLKIGQKCALLAQVLRSDAAKVLGCGATAPKELLMGFFLLAVILLVRLILCGFSHNLLEVWRALL